MHPFYKKIFHDINIDIVGFTNPQEGLAYIETEYLIHPVNTILFLDINMPGLNGWQVLDRLQAMPSYMVTCFTIYILSSSLRTGDVTRASQNPLVKDYLEKPLSNHLASIFSQFRELIKTN